MEFVSMSRIKLDKETDAVRYELEILRNYIHVKWVTKHYDLISISIHKPNFSETVYSIAISKETYYILTNCTDNDICELMVLNIINKNHEKI